MKYLCFILCFIISVSAFSQIDASKKSTTIPAVKIEEGAIGKSLFESKPIENNGLSFPNSDRINGLSTPKRDQLSTPNKKEFSMFGEKFGNPAELYEKQLNKIENDFKNVIESDVVGATTDQYLGDFKTKASRVRVLYRDYGAIDGDRVKVYVDKDIIIPNAYLTGSFTGFYLDLKPGFNVIDFQALNQGEAPPNTAHVMVVDEEGNVIATGYWGLATGVKATLIVVKE